MEALSSTSLTPSFPRQARGSYSKIICLACRARKIKCILPDPASLANSDTFPGLQPPDKACVRCKTQNLDCIVDRTILGRPSGKRARAEPATEEPEVEAEDDEGDGDVGVHDFVLSDVRSEVDAIGREREKSRPKPSKHEVFLALVDSTHLFAALMERDEGFGRAVVGEGRAGDVLEMVDLRLARALDARLVWHRLFFPYLPTLFSLHRELSMLEAGALHSNVTATLFALMCLIALDVPANTHSPAIPSALAQQLQSFVSFHAQTLFFNLPIHRHMLLVLELAEIYKPLALVTHRRTSASSLKGNLYATLAKRSAQKLGLDKAASELSALLSANHQSKNVKDLVLDCLLWCRSLMLESILDGYIPKPIEEQREPMPEVRKTLAAVKWALELHALPAAVIMMFHHLCSAEIEMQAAIDGKRDWQRLEALDALIAQHFASCSKLKTNLTHLLTFCADFTLPQYHSEVVAISTLRATELNTSHVRIGGMALFYSLMCGLHPPSSTTAPDVDTNVTPEDALQVSEEIIHHIKHSPQTPNYPTAIFSFLKRHGDPRVDMLENTLRDFVKAADTLTLEGIPYVPPALPTSSALLFTAREIVENNAARMKGWNGLHPNVDVQILLMQDVALRLESRDGNPCKADAIAKGSIFAAAAKLIRGLCAILAAWRRTIAEREAKEVVEKSSSLDDAGEFAGVEAFLQDGEEGGFDDWSDWPQAQGVNWGELFADGTEWAEWASALLPTDA